MKLVIVKKYMMHRGPNLMSNETEEI